MMPTLLDLDQTSSWVAHEFRVAAREAGWLVKRTGIESLFADREGALRVITREFSGAHLMLRSLPDMHARSRLGTYPVEVKAADSPTENVALELFQYCHFRALQALAVETWYCFGRATNSNRLEAWMAPVSAIRPFRIDVPHRVEQEWPKECLQALDRCIARLRLEVPDVRRGTNASGSGDPYLLIRKADIISQQPLGQWLTERMGGPPFTLREREAWEGKKDARQVWAHIPRSRWRTA